FIYQYIAFKTRNRDYLLPGRTRTLEDAYEVSGREGLDYLKDPIRGMQVRTEREQADMMWDIARESPRGIAERNDERVVQMIDEFQFINRFVFWDKEKTRQAKKLSASYLHTCEYRIAPMLVSGSWVGWLMSDLARYLPGRFTNYPLENISEDESVEMIHKYSLLMNIPVTRETAFLTAELTEGNPFYISALFSSKYPGRNLATVRGVRETLEFETLNLDANINTTWMEYLDSAFSRINDVHAKDMVLYLSKERHRFVSRRELKQKLGLEMSDTELEKKFRALYRSDIIEEHYGRYRGVQDNIFDKVFRRSYSDDIDRFITSEAPEEYRKLFKEIHEKYERLKGEYSRYKGAFAEFMIISRLNSKAFRENEKFRSMVENLPPDFEFTEYENVWSYYSPPLHEPEFQTDIFARATQGNYSLIGEVKNRKAKFSVKEAKAFREKAGELAGLENISKAVLFVFSFGGFHKNTLEYLKKHKIAWSADSRWLDTGI
ncbi:MAG: hypothetical protein GY749_08385, partial [Desulfobacteraceae bacterium]|nr:hypothetical protein [Desulfobacteraceae bacterium]